MNKLVNAMMAIVIIFLVVIIIYNPPNIFWSDDDVNKGFINDQTINFTPNKLIIPEINLEAKIITVGTKNGVIEAPKSSFEVGLWNSERVGKLGSVVMTGHVDNKRGAAVFYNLKLLKKGSEVFVQKNKMKLLYEVEKVKAYPRENVPMNDITCLSDKKRLNLITCTGTFDKKLKTYDHRLVVWCVLK